VLAHGAFADASGFAAVNERLRHDGYSSVTPSESSAREAAISSGAAALSAGACATTRARARARTPAR